MRGWLRWMGLHVSKAVFSECVQEVQSYRIHNIRLQCIHCMTIFFYSYVLFFFFCPDIDYFLFTSLRSAWNSMSKQEVVINLVGKDVSHNCHTPDWKQTWALPVWPQSPPSGWGDVTDSPIHHRQWQLAEALLVGSWVTVAWHNY